MPREPVLKLPTNGARAAPPKRQLQPALQTAGLQQYWRKFEEMGYGLVSHVLRVGRGKVRCRLCWPTRT